MIIFFLLFFFFLGGRERESKSLVKLNQSDILIGDHWWLIFTSFPLNISSVQPDFTLLRNLLRFVWFTILSLSANYRKSWWTFFLLIYVFGKQINVSRHTFIIYEFNLFNDVIYTNYRYSKLICKRNMGRAIWLLLNPYNIW